MSVAMAVFVLLFFLSFVFRQLVWMLSSWIAGMSVIIGVGVFSIWLAGYFSDSHWLLQTLNVLLCFGLISVIGGYALVAMEYVSKTMIDRIFTSQEGINHESNN